MTQLDSNVHNASLSQLLVALADFQQQQSEFARQQQEVSRRIEASLRELSQSVLSNDPIKKVDIQKSSTFGGPSVDARAENPTGKPNNPEFEAVVNDQQSVADEIGIENVAQHATGSDRVQSVPVKPADADAKGSIYKTASANKSVSPYKTLDQENESVSGKSVNENQTKLSQAVSSRSTACSALKTPRTDLESEASEELTLEPLFETAKDFTEEPVSEAPSTIAAGPSPYRTLDDENSQRGLQAPKQQTIEESNSFSTQSMAGSGEQDKGAAYDAVSENQVSEPVEDSPIRDSVKEIEQLLPTVDQFTNQLLDASDQQLKEAAVVEAFEPRKSKPVKPRKVAVPEISALTGEEETKASDDPLTSVREAIAMEATDERSLLDQIHRFTETLSESTSFWKQVTIPQADMEQSAPEKSLDPTASIAAQYENNSRSPYSH